MGEYFDVASMKRTKPIKGIIHIGAHYAEEAAEYAANNIPAVWFEAHPEYAKHMFSRLESYKDQIGVEALLSNVDGQKVDFWITADEFASSMFEPDYHQIQNPHAPITGKIQLTTKRFDTVWPTINVPGEYNFLILDTQGSELLVLEGIGQHLDMFDIIQAEYSTVSFYKNGPQLKDIQDFLGDGWTATFPNNQVSIHGDALFIRK